MNPNDSFQRFLEKIESKTSLSESESENVIEMFMKGDASDSQIAQILTAWKDKGVTVDELTGAALAMRALSTKITVSPGILVDTCGTGGDGLDTFNISTVAALTVAGAGIRVAKHGNRGSTSRCGSADLLEELGVKVDAEVSLVTRCIEEVGIGFLFAPKFHPAMKHVAPVRKQLGFRTIFNLLGPLTNPANVTHQMVGVADQEVVDLIAKALQRLGRQRFLVVHGVEERMDEVSPLGETRVVEFGQGHMKSYTLTPEQFGLRRPKLEELRGRDRAHCAQIARGLLEGTLKGPYRDATLLNAGCALYVSGAAEDIQEGIGLANRSLDSRRALRKLEDLRVLTNLP